jgi:aspartyl-tRNA(Asn)/glutamyl-tRNA(Gln) amidotransferase subunit A
MSDLALMTATELSQLFQSGRASPAEAVEAVIDRINRFNPHINAVCVLDAEGARAAAKESEARWHARRPLSPIDGVPVTIKELIRTRGFPLTMGSVVTDKAPATEDACAPARLREAGAVIVGLNTSPEWGHKGVTDSALNGITRNPWAPQMTPGGSSGGAAAAVMAGFSPIALGTDGGGSVRIPCSLTGISGLKGTFGRIPAWPPSMHGDLANTGPMAMTTADLTLVMNEITRPDPHDPFALPPDPEDYRNVLSGSVKGMRVAVIERPGPWIDAEVASGFSSAVATFAALGCHVESVEAPFDPEAAGTIFITHWMSALQRLLQFYPEEDWIRFDPFMLSMALEGRAFSASTLVDAMADRRELASRWSRLADRYDLILTPTTATAAFPVGRNFPDGPDGSPATAWTFTSVFNLTRQPAGSVNCGFTQDGLPFGLQIASGHYRDRDVLCAMHAFETARPELRRRPQL